MSKATPTDAAQDLAELLDTRLSPHSIGRIIRSFMETEQWSPRDPVDEHGNCLLAVWIEKLLYSDSRRSIPDSETLDLLLDGRPMGEVLARRLMPHKQPLHETLLTKLGNEASRSDVLDFLWSDRVFGSIEDKHLENVKCRWSEGGSPSNRRLNVLRVALEADRVEAARNLIEKGWGWAAPPDGNTPAVHIGSPQAWALFLETGGDPFMEVKGDGERVSDKPLWRSLLEDSHYPKSDARDAIEAWAKVHAGDVLKEKADEDYWKKLDFSYSTTDIMKAIRSRKDWAEVHNSRGENVLFVGLKKSLSVVSHLAKVRKADHLFSEVDSSGAGLWHHLMAKGQGVEGPVWKLAMSRATPRPNPEKGILVTLMDLPERIGQGSLPSQESLGGVLAPGMKGAPTSEDWWAGSKEDLTRLGLYLQGHAGDSRDRFYWGSFSQSQSGGHLSAAKAALSLSILLHAFPVPEDAPPELLGGLAINELLLSQSYPPGDRLKMFESLLEAGAKWSPPADVAKELEIKIPECLGEKVQSLYHRMVIDSALEPAHVSEPRPAMRL